MNKLSLLISLILIVFFHIAVFSFTYEKEKPVILKPPYQKVSVQLVKIKNTPKPKPKPQIKKVEVIEEKKQVFKKPIKKDAKRKLVKKVEKKIIKKKEIKKKIVKKKIKQKVLKKNIEKKEPVKEVKKIEKKIEQKPKKEEENFALKQKAQYLKKFEEFKNSYLIQLRTAIDKNKKYPTASKRLVEEGSVTVSFIILKNGLFQNIKLVKSSGKKRLDRAAIKAVSKTYKFKPFPEEIKDASLEINVPIRFKLNR